MYIAPWFWFCAVVLIFWGACGIFQKLSTNHISAESALIWLIVGFILLQPFVYPGGALLHYSARSIKWGLLSGFLSNLGAWGLYAAMKSGGKASIVAPLCALYPLVVVILAPFLLHESITLTQGAGVACALIAGMLLSA
jgi:transporter family protein